VHSDRILERPPRGGLSVPDFAAPLAAWQLARASLFMPAGQSEG
jgi:hypothetical protein